MLLKKISIFLFLIAYDALAMDSLRNIDPLTLEGGNLLMLSARWGDYGQVRLVLETQKPSNTDIDNALLEAVANNYREITRLLLKSGRTTTESRRKALLLATTLNHFAITADLLVTLADFYLGIDINENSPFPEMLAIFHCFKEKKNDPNLQIALNNLLPKAIFTTELVDFRHDREKGLAAVKVLKNSHGGPARFLMIKKIDEGSVGHIYSAHPVADKTQKVAIKSIENEGINEAIYLSMIQHPNIVQFIDLIVEHDVLYLVMEYVGSRMLASFLSDDRLDDSCYAELGKQTLEGLEYLHRQGIGHGDLRSNVMVNADGCVKIIDFGQSFGLGQFSYGDCPYCSPATFDQKDDICDFVALFWDGKFTDGEGEISDLCFVKSGGMWISRHELLKSEYWDKLPSSTQEFRDFLVFAIVGEKTQRPTATQLLTHTFFGLACGKEKIKELLTENKKRKRESDDGSPAKKARS